MLKFREIELESELISKRCTFPSLLGCCVYTNTHTHTHTHAGQSLLTSLIRWAASMFTCLLHYIKSRPSQPASQPNLNSKPLSIIMSMHFFRSTTLAGKKPRIQHCWGQVLIYRCPWLQYIPIIYKPFIRFSIFFFLHSTMFAFVCSFIHLVY